MNTISAIGKYLDQPILTAKVNRYVPLGLSIGAASILADKIRKTPNKEERKKVAIKNTVILSATAFSAISAPYIASKLTARKMPFKLSAVKEQNKKLVDSFMKTNPNTELTSILEKSRSKLLSLKEISVLFNQEKDFANILIPPPDNIQAKDIFKEIGYLSIYGAVPVVGGILGGIAADKIMDDNWKERVPDKVNEGFYQYLANIFMCNIGAGAALGILEKMNITSKVARCVGMILGIILTGVVGGSKIANFIANKVVNPVICKNKDIKEKRTPELLDISLHADDIATVSLLSGLKWIEPALPLLYSISGYRAGCGYRNNS